MLNTKVLVLETITVDGSSSGAVGKLVVTTLTHESRNDTMEY
tara:strand:+ start:92 stop:217 length:126 start_codon:yes stop_codon:yes gene_type:complete